MNSFYQGKLLKYQAILQSWSNLNTLALAQIANSVSIIEETQVKQKTCKGMCCYSFQVTTYFARANKHNS